MLGNSETDACQLERGHFRSPGPCNHRWHGTIALPPWAPPWRSHFGSFFVHLLFYCSAFWPVFCTTLLSPAQWIFYEPGNVGFCVEDWNINMACCAYSSSSRSDTKARRRRRRLDKLPLEQRSTRLFVFFVGRRGSCTSESFSNATCTSHHLHNGGGGKRKKKRKTLGDYFSHWSWFCTGCRVAYLPPESLGKTAHIHISSLSSLCEVTPSRRVCASLLPPAGFWFCGMNAF